MLKTLFLEDEKMSTRRIVVCMSVLAVFTSAVMADHYIERTGSHSWFDSQNWLDNSIPTSSDPVYLVGYMGTPEVCNIVSGQNAVAYSVDVGYSSAGITTTLNVTGNATLSLQSNLTLATTDDTVVGIMNVTDNARVTLWGNPATDGLLMVGQNGTGTLTMSGNAYVSCQYLYVSYLSTTEVGHVQLDGGLLDIRSLRMGSTGVGASMDIAGGTLQIRTARRAQVDQYVTSGLVTGNGLVGVSNFIITDLPSGNTTYQAIPEPITLALLGLGGLLLRSRKS
jgi:hypothetical protein